MQDFQSILQNRSYFGLFEYIQKSIKNETLDTEDQDQRSFTIVEDLNIIIIGWESVRHCTGQKLNVSGLAKEMLSDRVKQLINRRRTFESVKSRIKDYLVKLSVSDILNIALIYRDKLLPTASEPKSYPGLFGYYCCNLLINKERKMFEIEYGMKNKNKLNRRRFMFQVYQPAEIKDKIAMIMNDPFNEVNRNNERDEEEYDNGRDENSNHLRQGTGIMERKQQQNKYSELQQVLQHQDSEEQQYSDDNMHQESKLETNQFQMMQENNGIQMKKQQQQQIRQLQIQQQQQQHEEEQSLGWMDSNDISEQQESVPINKAKTMQYPQPDKFKQFLANAKTIKRRTLNYSDYLGNSKQLLGDANDQENRDYREDSNANSAIPKLPVLKTTSECANSHDDYDDAEDNQQFKRSRFQIFKKPTNPKYNRFVKDKQFLEEEPEEQEGGNHNNGDNKDIDNDDDIENIPDIENEYEEQQRQQQQQQFLKQQKKQQQKQFFQHQFQPYETNELANYPRKFIKTELQAMKYPIQNSNSIARMTINNKTNLNPVDHKKNENIDNTNSFGNSNVPSPSPQRYVESEDSQISSTSNQMISRMNDTTNLTKDASIIEEQNNETADDASFYYEQHVQQQKQSQQQQNSQKQPQQSNDIQEKTNVKEDYEDEDDDEEEFKQLIHLREWLGSVQGYYYSQMSQSQGGYYNNRYLRKDERSLRLLSTQRNSTSQFDGIWKQIQQGVNEQLEQESESQIPEIYCQDDSNSIEINQN